MGLCEGYPVKQISRPWCGSGYILTSVITIFILAACPLDSIFLSSARKALPDSATEVQEFYSGSWNGDYARCLKAKLPEADYPLFAKNLGLTEHFDARSNAEIASIINMGVDDAPKWWAPPAATSTTYALFKRGQKGLRVLKYSEGRAYLLSTSW